MIKTNYVINFLELSVYSATILKLEIAARLILIQESYKKFINQESEYPGLRIQYIYIYPFVVHKQLIIAECVFDVIMHHSPDLRFVQVFSYLQAGLKPRGNSYDTTWCLSEKEV